MSKLFSHVLVLFLFFVPLLTAAETLANADIDKYIKAVPVTAPALDAMKSKLEDDEALGKAMTLAQINGRLHRELLKLTVDWPEQTMLAERLKNEGCELISEWALVADRIAAAMASAQWVVAAASMPIPNSDRPTLDADTILFAYLQDEVNDEALRSKYHRQLEEMCKRMCVDTSDMPTVSNRYEDIRAALVVQ